MVSAAYGEWKFSPLWLKASLLKSMWIENRGFCNMTLPLKRLWKMIALGALSETYIKKINVALQVLRDPVTWVPIRAVAVSRIFSLALERKQRPKWPFPARSHESFALRELRPREEMEVERRWKHTIPCLESKKACTFISYAALRMCCRARVLSSFKDWARITCCFCDWGWRQDWIYKAIP
jgi:hypothetical protein